MRLFRHSARERQDGEAVSWLVRLQSDTATADDWVALTTWLEASPGHGEAFDRAALLSGDIDERAAAIAAGLHRASPAAPRRPWVSTAPWLAGAGVALAAGLVVALALSGGLGPSSTTYRTGIGETRDITLADGSKVRLDAASAMTVRLGGDLRQVTLADAQASFDITKDPRRPFVIAVGDQRVRVVGTAFNIRHFDHSVVVTVSRGLVDVSQPGLAHDQVARLAAGEELRHVEGAGVSTKRLVAPGAALSWQTGRLICDDEPLSQIVADLSRRYAVPITTTREAGARRFSGVLDLGDEALLVHRLASYLSLTARRTDREFTLN